MNSTNILGRLTRDPELKYTQSGTAIVRFTTAVNRKLSKEKRQQAEQNNQPTADFISCQAWGKTAETIAQYFKKGNRIGITGHIQTGSYEKDGTRIYTTDIVVDSVDFIENRQENTTANNANSAYEEQDEFFPIDNGNIPF